MAKLRDYLQERLPLIAVSAALGVGLALSERAPGAHDLPGLSQALSTKVEGKATTLAWEPSRGAIFDFLFGRPLLFEARKSLGQATSPRDIFRTLIRLTPEGKVISIGHVYNLTQTEKSDEHNLTSNHSFAVWSSESEKAPSALSVIRFVQDPGNGASVLDRLQLGLSHLLKTGTWKGLERMDIIAPDRNSSIQIKLTSSEMSVVTESSSHSTIRTLPLKEWEHAETRASTRTTQGSKADSNIAARLVPRERQAIPWAHFLANTMRELWGVEFVGRLERAIFAAHDGVKRTGYQLGQVAVESSTTAPRPASKPHSKGLPNWPPAPFAFADSRGNEGRWSAWESSLLPKAKEPLFYRTVIHHDPERRYAELHLVAFDMRRLRLGMRAGYEDPEPDTGPPGSGHVPMDIAPQIVATFNGAFKTTHGKYGMKAEGRILNDPVDGAATVRVEEDGRVGMGTWSPSDDAATALELRQNLDALVENGMVNPTGRTTWGEHVDATGVAIERSALCLHESGHLIYAWATEATGQSLAEGLKRAGCRYAMHLDMNPGHCTFALNRIQSVDPVKAQGELLDPRMRAKETRYVRWSPKDFFYLALRDPRSSSAGTTELQFVPTSGKQPSPEYIPGVFHAIRSLGPLQVQVWKVNPDRVKFQFVQGRAETLPANAAIDTPSLAPYPEALMALGLGHQTHGFRAGLSIGSNVLVPLSRGYGTLLLKEGQPPLALPPGEPTAEVDGVTAVQLPALARDGRLLEEAKELGGRRERQALCFDQAGAFYFGKLSHDTIAPLAQTLLDLGCKLVLEADRGSKSAFYAPQKDTEVEPQVGWAQSVLYVLDREMTPSTYQF